MSNFHLLNVIETHHWTDRLFSLKATRDPSFRFESGQFVMIGLEINNKLLMRAYSIASATYDDHLEFFSVKAPGGVLTSVLKHIRPGDGLFMGKKPTGSLRLDNLRSGRNLYLLATGTGLAPFLSIIRDAATYERYQHVILAHGSRYTTDLAYADFVRDVLPRDQLVGDNVRAQLLYYPTVTREPTTGQPRLTELLADGRLTENLDLPLVDPRFDRFMLCGSIAFLTDARRILDTHGFVEGSQVIAGDYVYEKAFAC